MSLDDAQMRGQASMASDKGFNTGTDGYVPQALDKALLGGAPQRVGRFEYRYDTDHGPGRTPWPAYTGMNRALWSRPPNSC
jgi:hypothetical protein